MHNGHHASQFKRLKVRSDLQCTGFSAYIAIWRNSFGEVVIGAPTLNALETRWRQITGLKLERDRAQHVAMIHGPSATESAPDELDPDESQQVNAP